MLSSLLKVVMVVVLLTAVCFIPLWIFLGVYHLINPGDFWQKFATVGLGMIFGGSIQIAGLVFWIFGLIGIFTDFKNFKNV